MPDIARAPSHDLIADAGHCGNIPVPLPPDRDPPGCGPTQTNWRHRPDRAPEIAETTFRLAEPDLVGRARGLTGCELGHQ